ncbi:MAG: hypothetical protein ACI8X3_003252, partial [Saprospiraceae bacterium]
CREPAYGLLLKLAIEILSISDYENLYELTKPCNHE